MQTKSMGEEVCKVKCQFRWKIRNQTKHREGKEKSWFSEQKNIQIIDIIMFVVTNLKIVGILQNEELDPCI